MAQWGSAQKLVDSSVEEVRSICCDKVEQKASYSCHAVIQEVREEIEERVAIPRFHEHNDKWEEKDSNLRRS